MNFETAFILGMHRSGTSALVRTLNLLGLAISRDLLAANEFNEPGYWEPRQIVRFNDRLLAAFDRNWADPKPMPSGWQMSETAARSVPQAAAVLEAEFGGQARMVVKDPRLSRVLPVWREALEQRGGPRPVCFICCRNPLEVYQSLASRDRFGLAHALHLWMTYLLEAEVHTRGLPRAIVHYESLLEDWPRTLRLAFAAMNLPATFNNDGKARDIDVFIDRAHRHHASTPAEVAAHADVPALVKDAYALVLHDLPLEQEAEFDRLRQRWQRDWAALSPGMASSSFAGEIPEWHMEKSRWLKEANKIDEALAAIDRAIARWPDLAQLHSRRGNLLLRIGRLEEAERVQRQAIALKSDSPWLHEALAKVFERMDRAEHAMEALEQAIERGPEIARLHHRLGILLLKTGKLEEAAAAQRQAIALDDRPHWFHEALATALERLHRSEEAIDALDQAIERAPDVARLYHRKGALLAGLGRFSEAEGAQRRAIAANDRSPGLHEALAAILERMGRHDAAVEAVQCAVEGARENGRLRQREAILLARADRLAEAEEALARSTELDRKLLARTEGLVAAKAEAGDVEAIRDMSRFLGGVTARHWAGDIEAMLCKDIAPVSKGQDWPLGRREPERIVPQVEASDPPSDAPLISVMIPAHEVHDESRLCACIESVLVQDRGQDWAEIVIVDDASSSDTTQKIAERYAGRVTYRRNDANLDVVASHNHCINVSRGQFIHCLYQDDFVEPEFYARLVEPLLRDASLVAACANYRHVDGRGGTTSRQALARTSAGPFPNCLGALALGRMIEFSSIIVRRSAYLAVGGFSPSLGHAFDWDIWGRVAKLGPIWYEPCCLAGIRVHRQSAAPRVAPLERLIDEMRCVFHLVAALPADKRRQSARVALVQLMPKYWSMAVSPPQGLSTSGRARLVRFLTRGTAELKDDAVVANLLRRLRGN